MPILDDIMDHAVLGRERRKGIEIGREEGRQIFLHLIEKRFGPVQPSARKRIQALSWSESETIALRLLDAQTLDELLG
jgi:hypothetical protein